MHAMHGEWNLMLGLWRPGVRLGATAFVQYPEKEAQSWTAEDNADGGS